MENLTAFSKYLPHSDRDVLWQIYCTCVGFSKIPPGASYPFRPKEHPPGYVFKWERGRTLNEYQIIFITKGSGKFRSANAGTANIKEGFAFILFPGEKHSYHPDPDIGWDEYWVGFRGEYPEKLENNGFISRCNSVLHPGLQETIIESFHTILEIARREPTGFQQKLGGSIITLIARLLSFSQQKEQGTEVDLLVQRARCLFEEYIYDHIEMKDLAKILNIDYSEFRKIFKKYTGMSPYQYFLNLKINRAKNLLSQDNYSIKEIAYKLAFENQYYFSRLFKSKTGIPPSAWHG